MMEQTTNIKHQQIIRFYHRYIDICRTIGNDEMYTDQNVNVIMMPKAESKVSTYQKSHGEYIS